MQVFPGQIFSGQYRIDSFIASGGMGAVYRVFDLKRNVPLAMKMLHSDLAEDESSFRHFKAEADHLQNLNHPNIVRFYGLYQADELTFLLEDFIDGSTLKEVLKNKGGPLPLPDVLAFMRALTSALGYAHANQVVHCDVKPGNVMVDRSGRVFLTDFGISRQADSTVTTFASAGTPAYMAPEQINGEGVLPQTDIYALGVVLFEMLTGQLPFRGKEGGVSKGNTASERIRYAHLHLRPPDPGQLNPALPPTLANVIFTALAKEPGQRFPGMSEFYLAVMQAIGYQPEQGANRLRITPDLDEKRDSEPISPPPFPQPAPPLPPNPNQTISGPKRMGPPYSLIALLAIFAVVIVIIFSQSFRPNPGLATIPSINTASLGKVTAITASITAVTVAPTPTPAPTLPSRTPSPTFTVRPTTATLTPLGISHSLGLIAFTQGDADHGQIYLYDPVTRQTWKPAGQPDNCQAPSFSWDARTMLIRCDPSGSGQYQIFSIPTSGGRATQLTFQGNNMEGVYSPDGKRIAFVKQTEQYVKNLFIMDSSGRNERALTSEKNWNDDPQWSPDGRWLVFESSRSDKKCPGCTEIFLLAPDSTSPPTMVTGSVGLENFTPSWSPDGKSIAFECRPDQAPVTHVCTINRDGSNYKQYTRGYTEERPVWSPDGKDLVYTLYEADGSASIQILSLAGSHPIQKLASGFNPAWSVAFSE